MPEKKKLNRRKFVRNVSAIGASVALTSPAAAAGSDIDEDNVQFLLGDEKVRAARRVSELDVFSTLTARARADGATWAFETDQLNAAVVDHEDVQRLVVEFKLSDVDDADSGSIVIGVDQTTEQPVLAVLEYITKTYDGITQEIRHITAINNDVNAESTQVSASDELTESSVEIDVDGIREIRDSDAIITPQGTVGDIHSGFSNASAISGVLWDYLDDDVDIDGCYACGFGVGLVCSVGCSAGGAFICGLTGIAVPVAGLSCAGFVAIVCDVADSFSGCGEAVAEYVCTDQTNWC